jgi:AcrR family transcriptional regulator
MRNLFPIVNQVAYTSTVSATEEARDGGPDRPKRADARRNVGALLEAAKAVFATSGVDAPAKEITDRAGVGVGTLYRHFPRRADLVVAVLRHEIDACAAEAAALRTERPPLDALRGWVDRYVELVGTKRGLAEALHSDDATFAGIGDHVAAQLGPVVADLLADARSTGDVRSDITALELIYALALLCHPVAATGLDGDYNRRMIAVFVDGLRHAG